MYKISYADLKSNKKDYVIVTLILFVLIVPIGYQHAYALTTVEWIENGVTLPNLDIINHNAGDVIGIDYPVSLRVVDTGPGGFDGNGMFDSISVSLSSSSGDVITLNLNEVGDTGEFVNNKVILMADNDARLSLLDSITLSVFNSNKMNDGILNDVLTSGGNGGFVMTDSTTFIGGISVDLFEVNDTGLFIRTLSFCSLPGCSDSAVALLEANADDTITFFGESHPLTVNNGYFVSNTGNGAIIIQDAGTVTVSYKGINSSIITQIKKPGGGGGGVVTPGLVVDSPSSGPSFSTPAPSTLSSSSCTGDCTPPTLGIDKNLNRIVFQGFSYNDNPVDVDLYYTPYPLITVNVGQENLTVLKIFDNGGPQNIAHVGFGFGMGKGESFNDSKSTINLDITKDGTNTTTLYDPENVLENVKVETAIEPCSPNSNSQCLVVFIYHTFREPLNFNMVATYVWDFNRNSWQNYYNHGIEIVGESLNPPKKQLVAFGTHEMRGLFELVRIDKKDDLWKDEFGNVYQHLGNDRFDVIHKVPNEIVYDRLSMNGCDRNCNWFEYYKQHESLLAQITLNDVVQRGKAIQNEFSSEPFSHVYDILERTENAELQKLIVYEQERANKLYEKMYLENSHR